MNSLNPDFSGSTSVETILEVISLVRAAHDSLCIDRDSVLDASLSRLLCDLWSCVPDTVVLTWPRD